MHQEREIRFECHSKIDIDSMQHKIDLAQIFDYLNKVISVVM